MCKLKSLFEGFIGGCYRKEGMIQVAKRKPHMAIFFTMFPQYDNYGQINKYVQIDWMVGDLPWLKFAYHSGESGSLKGMHRTQLMVAMLSNKGYTFSALHRDKKKKLIKSLWQQHQRKQLPYLIKLFGTICRWIFIILLDSHHFLKNIFF